MLLKYYFVTLLALSFSFSAEGARRCENPWVFFDTGQTLVVTPADYKNLENLPEAEKYLDSLNKNGFTLGMIVNVPEDWGSEIAVDDPMTKRLLYTQQFFQENWKPGSAPFPWRNFGRMKGKGKARIFKGAAFFPMKNSDRKPEICPSCVFTQALAAAKAAGCAAVYQGEDPVEMEAAEKAGFIPFQVGVTDPSSFFLREEKIFDYVTHYVPGLWKKGLAH